MVVGQNKFSAAVFHIALAPLVWLTEGQRSFCQSEALVDHELFERVQVRWYQRADGFVIVVKDLLPLALRARRAGGPDQAGVWSAVTLVETFYNPSILTGKNHSYTETHTHYTYRGISLSKAASVFGPNLGKC